MKIFVFSKLNMTLSAVALLLFVKIVHNYKLDLLHYIFFGLSVWWVYIFDILSGIQLEDQFSHPARGQFVRHNQFLLKILLFTISFILFGLLLFISFPTFIWPIFTIALLVAILYSKGLFRFRLKSSGVNKTVLVALAWSLGTYAYAKILSARAEVTRNEALFFFIIYLFLFLDTYLLDYHDQKSDAKFQIKTAAHSKNLNTFFAPVNTYLSTLSEEYRAFWVSSWRYIFLAMALVIY